MLNIDQLRFRYPGSDFELVIDSLEIGHGEKVAIVGPSGSGKTTLLNLIAGISVPDSGNLNIDGVEVGSLTDSQRRDFRISKIGMVFQQFELIDYLTAYDNLLLPFAINATLHPSANNRRVALRLATAMGIGDKLNRRPAKLSQGEQQRVAVGRALINQPDLILADEPTGNLDPANKQRILDILFEQSTLNNQTLIVVTHDLKILEGFDRTIDFGLFRVATPASGDVA
jgi:putative ABC transport system ATP-binding protein